MSRARIFASLVVIVPLGFWLKLYKGPGAHWLNDSFDGALYEIFWCLVAAFVVPRARPVRIAAGVLIATCALEFLQLWHPPFLEAIRSHFLGAAILGTTFDWMDFPYYFLGCLMGWAWLRYAISARPSATMES
ncbi:MAG TPA: DUF2809 domain-containing protein [Bryobacteraceae bacterium]|jgi:hypothetical protein|nr:DUF2809 domain-containing protein [Bryobacteraceae bacterium]